MARLFAKAMEEYKAPVIISLESVREDIRLCNNVKNKLNNIKSNIHDRESVIRDLPYVNSILLKHNKMPIRVSREDNLTEVNAKVEDAESDVADIATDLATKEQELAKQEQEQKEQVVTEPTVQETEVEPIRKYPLNEKTLTTYAISTPNLLSATAAAVKVGDGIEDAPTVVDVAKSVMANAATNENMVNVIQEGYDYKKSLISNVMRFYNSKEGKTWLMSPKGQEWISYVASKHSISKEEDLIDTTKIEEPDFEDIKQPDDVVIAMENSLGQLDYIVNGRSDYDDEDIEAVVKSEETEEALSDNADKITRLENTIDLLAAGIDSVDSIQASSSVTIESAKVYSNILHKLAADTSAVIGYELNNDYVISKEDLKYDPVGGLSIAREQLLEVLTAVYEQIKKMVLKAIKLIKQYLNASNLQAKLVSGRAMALLEELKTKRDISDDKFATIENELVEKYRPLLYVLDFDLSEAKDYLNALVNNPMRHLVQQPLKDVYGYLNKLNSDIKADKAANVGSDLDKILDTMHMDNVVGKVFRLRNRYVAKLDHVTVNKKDASKDVYPVFVSGGKAFGLTCEVNEVSNGKEVSKYDMVRLDFSSLQGSFRNPPSRRAIDATLQVLKKTGLNTKQVYKESEDIIEYAKSFIESFRKFDNSTDEDTMNVKEISLAISSVVSYAKAITIKYATTELVNYVNNCKALLNICSSCIDVMD